MKFEKGHKGYKPKGAISQKTREWDNLGEFLTQSGAERAASIMSSCDDEQFMKYYTQMLEYFKPKHARSEVTNKGETKTIVEFVRTRLHTSTDQGSASGAGQDSSGEEAV